MTELLVWAMCAVAALALIWPVTLAVTLPILVALVLWRVFS